MDKKIIAVLIAIVAIASVMVFSGCIEKIPESATPETPLEIPTKSEGTVIDVMKQVPNGSSLMYVDLKNLRKDSDLANIYEMWKNHVIEHGDAVGIPEVGISTNKLNYLAKVIAKETGAVIIGGDFDLEKIRGYLDDAGLKQDTYRGEEIWYIENGGNSGIALFKDKIIIGDARRIIQVMKGEEKNLYDNKDAVDVVNNLPKGFYVTINSVEGGLGCLHKSKYEAGCKNVTSVGSSSLEKISKEEVKWQQVVKFKDERAAEDFVEHWNEGWTAEKYPELEVTAQNKFVICTMSQKITETAW